MTEYEAPPPAEDEPENEDEGTEEDEDPDTADLTPPDPEEAPAPRPVEHPVPARPKAEPRATRRKPRSDLGQAHGPRTIPWSNREAPLMWGEMLGSEHPKALSNRRPAMSAFDVAIEVIQVDAGRNAVWLGSFDGSAVMGSQNATPGEQLVNYVIDKFHAQLGPNQGPADYEIRFVRKIDNAPIGRGKLAMPSMMQINNMRRARMTDPQAPAYAPSAYAQMPQSMGTGLPPGYVPPSPSQYVEPPRYAVSGGFGAPPAAGYGASARALELEAELQRLREREAMLRGQLESERGARTRAEARMPEPGMGAPPRHEEISEEDRETRIAVKALRMLGYRPGQPLPSQAQAQAPAPAGVGAPNVARGPLGAVKQFIDQGTETMDALEQMLSHQDRLESFVKRAGKRYGLEPTTHEEARAEVVDEAAERAAAEEEALPFRIMEIPETSWKGNPNVKYATDKETGDISLAGLAAANPQYVMPLVEKLVVGLGDLAKVIGQAFVPKSAEPQAEAAPSNGAAEVVSEIPQGATNGAADHSSGF